MSTDTAKDKRLSATTAERSPAEYEVGYRKPPVAYRFKKGVSGNPKGRPPGRRNPEAPKALGTASDEPENRPQSVSRPGVSDEELLRLVKARKLTW